MITGMAETTGEFVDALIDFLLASGGGSPSLQLRSRLAKARAEAQRRPATQEYRNAVLMAEHAVR
jgi:hypothetical protein